jgi:agmatine/peptidylarginine deiminase
MGLIAEFEKQNFTQIIFPHKQTDWICCLNEAEKVFIDIIETITKYQKCLIVCADVSYVKQKFASYKNMVFVEYETNDTWARDCSALSVFNGKDVELLDFTFNGWGGKFDSKKDNAMSQTISKHYKTPMKSIDFILEGGGVETNGADLLLTTSKCMLNKNRNNLSKKDITNKLKSYFGVSEVLYLEHGYLAGDDTDSHVDTLARFIDKKTIMYVTCRDKNDEHYKELKLMEEELKVFTKKFGLELIPLPFPDAIYDNDERLPATYANFLFVNGAILVPVYDVKQDKEALDIFRKTFKNKDIIPINCKTLIRQHGSLHCVTMNFSKSVLI